jgi:hypothetical protein
LGPPSSRDGKDNFVENVEVIVVRKAHALLALAKSDVDVEPRGSASDHFCFTVLGERKQLAASNFGIRKRLTMN